MLTQLREGFISHREFVMPRLNSTTLSHSKLIMHILWITGYLFTLWCHACHGEGYKSLVRTLTSKKCTQTQFSVLLVGNERYDNIDCGDIITPSNGYQEGTSRMYASGTFTRSTNCIAACVIRHKLSYHAEGGVIQNARLLNQLHRKPIWLITYYEPCFKDFIRTSNKQTVHICSEKNRQILYFT